MDALRFLIIGLVSLAIWMYIGYRLYTSNNTNPSRFAFIMSFLLSVIVLLLLLTTGPINSDSLILGLLLVLIIVLSGYPITYFLYKILLQRKRGL